MGECKCGCGEPASNGDFIAGHSQKLTANSVKEVGGLFVLQELILSAKKYAYGQQDSDELPDLIRRIFPLKQL